MNIKLRSTSCTRVRTEKIIREVLSFVHLNKHQKNMQQVRENTPKDVYYKKNRLIVHEIEGLTVLWIIKKFRGIEPFYLSQLE